MGRDRNARLIRWAGIAATTVALTACSTESAPEPGGVEATIPADEPDAGPTEPTEPPDPAEPPAEPEEAEPPPLPEDLSAEALSTGLAAPWSVAFHGETPIVSERDAARILELDPDGEPREIGTIAGVNNAVEGGLLGLAVIDDHLYAYFTTDSDNRIQRYPIGGEPGTLELGSAEEILTGIPAGPTHNGGRIAVGPDGMLYATTGDAGIVETSQDLDSLAGKILRMTPDGDAPDDNPFDDSLVYSYGHRNPQGIGWDPDGTMYSSEFGQNTWDELNVIEPGGNYGWPIVEGIAGDGDYLDPVQQWTPSDASPSGIAVTENAIYIANLRGERLRVVPLDDLTDAREFFAGEYGRLRDVVETPSGELWIITNNTDGRGDPAEDDDRILVLTY